MRAENSTKFSDTCRDPCDERATANCEEYLFVILRRYMTRQVASTTALVLGFLVVMMLGGRLIRYFGIAAEGNLDIGLLFTIIGYNLPYFWSLSYR